MPYQFSNGLDQMRVVDALKNRLGWKSQQTPSASGRYFDDGSFHALVTEATLRSLQPTASIEDAAFETFKQAHTIAIVRKALDAVFCKPLLIEQTLIYDLQPDNRPAELPQGLFSGYQINIADSNDFILKVEAAILHFDSATPVKLYLFREGDALPVWEQTVQAVAGQFTVADLADCYISYAKSKASRFFFGYKPVELESGAMPFVDYIQHYNNTLVFGAHATSSPSVPILGELNSYGSQPFGLNLEISSLYDFTHAVVKSPQVFDELLGLMNAATIIEMGLFTNRRNSTERAASDGAEKLAAQLDLTGVATVSDGPSTEGLRHKIKREIAQVKASFNKKQFGVRCYT